MQKIMFAVLTGLILLPLAAAPSRADEATCTAQAVEKKLAGAAKNSFMKKCETSA